MRPLAVLTLVMVLAACGGDEPEPAPEQAQPAQQRPQPAARPEAEQPAAEPRSEPAPEPEASEPTEPAQELAMGSLYTVQVAAFTRASTAREWVERLRAEDLPVWTSTAEVGGRTFHRVRVGALPSLADTRRLGGMVRARYHWPIWVAPLTPADRLPVNAVQNTRALLTTGLSG